MYVFVMWQQNGLTHIGASLDEIVQVPQLSGYFARIQHLAVGDRFNTPDFKIVVIRIA